MFTKPKQHVIEIIYGRGKFVGYFNMGTLLKIYRICPIRIEIIYGRGKFVGDFNMGNIICANFTPRNSQH